MVAHQIQTIRSQQLVHRLVKSDGVTLVAKFVDGLYRYHRVE